MQIIDKVRTKAHLNTEVTELEVKNRAVALKAANEAIVLLKNNGHLPLKAGTTVAMYGDGITNTVKCGSGSGECNNRENTSIYDGMKSAGFCIVNDAMLQEYIRLAKKDRTEYVAAQIKKAGFLNFNVTMSAMAEPYSNPPFKKLSEGDLIAADTCIYVVSRISGEGYDRKLAKGDYYLSDLEKENILLCASKYEHMVLIINAGGIVDYGAVDTVDFDGVLYMAMLGETGGEAVASILSGKVNPSGHLTDSWAVKYEDIPFAKEYSYLNGDTNKEYYKDDIFVGYRYYDTFGVEPKFPFGYGLSYTSFEITGSAVMHDTDSPPTLAVKITVKNTGTVSGKAVAQVYVSCPDGKLKKEYQRLTGFAKTGEILPGAGEDFTVEIPLTALASYDAATASSILEKGNYIIRLGDSSRNTRAIAILEIENTMVVSKHDNICPLQDELNIMAKPDDKISDGGMAETQKAKQENPDITILKLAPDAITTSVFCYEEMEPFHSAKVDEWMSKLSDQELADFVVGCGNDMLIPMEHYYTTPGATGYSTNKYFGKEIHDIAFCDGPAGLRLQQQAVVIKGKNKTKAITSSIDLLNYMPKAIKGFGFGSETDGTPVYQYCTAFPVGTALAQTWNQELVEEVGRAANAELEEYNITFWLAPGMNIHKNPLCGRNYEYYSEDPCLTGKIAAAMTRGAQSGGNHSVSLKHFFCNNQESNRQGVSAVVSERAIREIYLPGFEIAVKEGHAKGVMTSYNMVNGVYSAVNRDALTKVLRNEWGFDGLVMTDWDNMKKGFEADKAVYAGVDIQMAGEKKQAKLVKKALKSGSLDSKYVRLSASRVLRMIANVDMKDE